MVYIYVVTSAIVIKATVQAVLAALWVITFHAPDDKLKTSLSLICSPVWVMIYSP